MRLFKCVLRLLEQDKTLLPINTVRFAIFSDGRQKQKILINFLNLTKKIK